MNIKLREVESEIGFADGEILGCERIGATLVVRVKMWNAKIWRVDFKDAQLVLDLLPGDISGFYCYLEETDLIQKALKYVYETCPLEHSFKHYVFMNNDDVPCLDIVAVDMELIETRGL